MKAVDRHTGFSVFVFNDTNIKPPNGSKVFTHNPATCPQNVMNVTVNRVTTGVAIFNSNNASLKQYCRDYKTQFASIELCEVYVMGCPAGQFGSLCDMCDIRCLNGQCDAFNGSCIYGCHNPLKTPPGCNVCIDGYYGEFCEQCGHCETPKSCNRENGRCGTCQQHWDMPDCKQCKKGYFGNNCSLECGHCLSGTFCDNITGECPTGCEDQWSGTHCDECNKGYYGENCALECGHCLPGTSCNNITGQCLEGCRDKWKGTKCDECQDGLYGHECNSMCGACNITNPAYVKDSGVCLFGCRPKWKGTNCNVCSPYKYGPNCAFDCGHCKDGSPCSTGNGSCLSGCEDGWGDISCLKASPRSDRQGLISTDKSPTTGLYVTMGVLSTLLTITVVVVIVLVHIVRKQNRQPSHQHDNNPPQSFANHIEMEGTHDYDKLGVRDTDDYQEIPTVVDDQLPQERHASDSNYINSTLQ